jgi:hypothetical protein
MEEILTASEVMDALGGNTGVRMLTGSTANAVSNWRAFGTFPSSTYVVMLAALNARGKTAPASLWKMREIAS